MMTMRLLERMRKRRARRPSEAFRCCAGAAGLRRLSCPEGILHRGRRPLVALTLLRPGHFSTPPFLRRLLIPPLMLRPQKSIAPPMTKRAGLACHSKPSMHLLLAALRATRVSRKCPPRRYLQI